MSTWLVAVAGGAVGTLLTWVGLGIGLLARAPKQIATNERAVRERDEDLASWIVDRDIRLRRDLRGKRNELAARGMLQSGEYAYGLGLLKEAALHEWRDEERGAQREVARIRDRESWQHRLWRRSKKIGRKPLLLVPEKATAVLDNWRAPPREGGDPSARLVPFDDPTERSLERAVSDAPGMTTEYQ